MAGRAREKRGNWQWLSLSVSQPTFSLARRILFPVALLSSKKARYPPFFYLVDDECPRRRCMVAGTICRGGWRSSSCCCCCGKSAIAAKVVVAAAAVAARRRVAHSLPLLLAFSPLIRSVSPFAECRYGIFYSLRVSGSGEKRNKRRGKGRRDEN